jgi:DNA invertase Pin-like site-specific DNA recombinase
MVVQTGGFAVKVGYARVSTRDQDPQLQLDALKAADVDEILTEHASGKDRKRPELERALAKLEAGDTLVVWKLDRLGRSVVDLANIVNDLGERGVEFRSLTEGFDTTTNGGKLLFHVMAAMAEYERAIIRERVQNGVDAARKQGRVGGRPSKLTDDDLDLLVELWDRGTPVTTLAEKWDVDKATIYRAYNRAKARQAVPTPST